MKREYIYVIIGVVLLSVWYFNKGDNDPNCIDGDCKNSQGTYIFSNGTKYLKSKNHPIVNKKFKIDTSDLRKLGFKNNQKIEDGIFDLLKKI